MKAFAMRQYADVMDSLGDTAYDPRTHVRLGKETVANVSARDFPGVYPGEDLSWNEESARRVGMHALLLQAGFMPDATGL
ncbi:DNA-directed RNA polymerase core subunit rpc40 [Cystobasidiomycetes sp. EMM_F5]